MKIGLIRRGYSATGGAERYLLRFAEGMEAAGHTVVLFSDRAWPDDVWADRGREMIVVGAEDESIDTERPDRGEKPDDFIGRLKWQALTWKDATLEKSLQFYEKQKLKRKMSPSRFANELRDEIKPREHCDCLFSLERVWDCDCFRAGDGVHAAWMKRRAAHESTLRTLAHRFSYKHEQIIELERSLYAGDNGPHIIANSTMVADEIQKFYSTPNKRITVVPNGYDLPLISAIERETVRAEERKTLGLGEFDTAFLFVGTGWERKGLKHAIYATQRIASLDGDKLPVRLLVAGKDRKVHQPIIHHKGDPVQYLGPVNAVALARLYLAADVFVLPTLYDPFSNATLEAAAFGLPIITTDANGFSEHMPPFAGTVIDEPKGGLLLTAFREWRDPKRREGVWEKNTATAAEFSVKRNINASVDVFLKLMKNASPKTKKS